MEELNKKDKISKKFLICLLVIVVVFTTVIAISVSAFEGRKPEVVINEENGGNIKLVYSDDTNSLSISNALPVTDLIGMKKDDVEDYFDFSIDVNLDNSKEVDYEISINKVDKLSTIPDTDIKIYLEKEESGTYVKSFGPANYKSISKVSDLGSSKGSMIIHSEKRKKSGIDNYRLRIWLSDTSLISKGDYSVEINVNGKAK